MGNTNEVLDKLVDRFIDTGELGSWDETEGTITLHDIKHEENIIAEIRKNIEEFTTHYNIDIIPTIDGYVNINIRDIKGC